MKTNTIKIDSELHGRTEAIHEAEKFSAYHNLTGKQAKYIRLLSEESISMVHGILNGFEGDFWLESERTEEGLLCRICVAADVKVNAEQEQELLGVSSSGKNEETKGIMGKIRQLFRLSLQPQNNQTYESTPADMWYGMGMYYAAGNLSKTPRQSKDFCWSLQQYREFIDKNSQPYSEEWDELEKSIVSRLADEVKVGIRSGRAEVVIEKRF